jgi:glycosyltransferase involved in cell wall biosynthesis
MPQNPTWSVMIPLYNGTRYLIEALDSVVAQGFDEREMQIEVIDDCSTQGDPESIITTRYAGRVSYYRQPERMGMAANWNACIRRAIGSLIHILHQDDYVANGYYTEINDMADKYPRVGLYSTRSFFVDNDSIITGITGRIRELEQPANATEPFFYETPIQCAGITVRRTSYEALGGFRLDMGYVTDCEMWARVTGEHGAIVSPKIKAFYRMGDGTETHRTLRAAEGIGDICRLNEVFVQQYPSFCIERGRCRVSAMAWEQHQKFKRLGDDAAAATNYDMWVRLTPASQRLARHFDGHVMRYFRGAWRLGLVGAAARLIRR